MRELPLFVDPTINARP